MEQSEKRPKGRPTKLNDEIAQKITELVKEGYPVYQICDILNISRNTVKNWQKDDLDFLIAFKKAKMIADEMVELSLFKRATGYSLPETKVFNHEGEIIEHTIEKHYPADTQAAMFWLRNRRPDVWKEKVESDNVQNNAIINITPEQQEKLKQKFDQLMPDPETLYLNAKKVK